MRTMLGPVQQAIYNRLQHDAALISAGYRVFDEPPDEADLYIVIGDATEVKRGTYGREGREPTETVHLWRQGASSLAAQNDAELVRAALEDTPLTIDEHTVALCTLEFIQTLKEPGRTPEAPSWRHVPMRFRIWVREGTTP